MTHVLDTLERTADLAIGRRIRRRRLMRRWSQARLGREVDTSYQQIQKYETGECRVTAARLVSIARALEVEIAFFFDDFSDTREAARAGEVMAMAQRIRRLPSYQRAALDNLVATYEQGAPETPA